jgi:glycine/D-amino acid oxidase-like deaminating enzyme
VSAASVAVSLADAEPAVFWLDDPSRPEPRAPMRDCATADLVVVGGGFSGLWTAVLAKERHPEWDVVLLEGKRIGWAASGRNGGFCSASLTHGPANGRRFFPREAELMERLGEENLKALEQDLARHGVDCQLERTGGMVVATAPHQVQWLADEEGKLLDRDAVRRELASPTYLAGAYDRTGTVMLNPGRLAWGLAAAAGSLGVQVHEGTSVTGIERRGARVLVITPAGNIDTPRVALGTSAFPNLIRRLRLHTVPVYDYVLVTEPLSPAQLDTIGWRNRQGVSDMTNQFHYYRLTADNRILWGGYDAIYHYARRMTAAYEQRPQTFARLAEHFFETFPQLAGLRFTHRWGGAIDTCTRFCAFFGTAHRGRVAYGLGYTGLGVGASRFGARVMLDLLSGEPTELTELEMVRRRPLPFPPEPAAYLGIELTRWSLARADERQGARNLWLRALDTLGLGFDS